MMAQEAADGIHVEIERHHAAMVAALKELAGQIFEAKGGDNLERARDALIAYVDAELLPHAEAEESTLYARGAKESSLTTLVASMTREHEVLRDLRTAARQAISPAELMLTTGALVGVFETHAAKENEFLVPGLIVAGVDIGALLGTMREKLAGH